MSADNAGALAEVLASHEFQSTSTSRNGFSVHRARCSCDSSVEFDWYERDSEYREHLHAAIYAAGMSATRTEQTRPEHEAESVIYFVELDDMGSADQYDTEQEARDALAQHGGYRVLKCVTYDLEVQP